MLQAMQANIARLQAMQENAGRTNALEQLQAHLARAQGVAPPVETNDALRNMPVRGWQRDSM